MYLMEYLPFQRKGNTFVLRFKNGMEINLVLEKTIERTSERTFVEELHELFERSSSVATAIVIDLKTMQDLTSEFRYWLDSADSLLELLCEVYKYGNNR